MLRCLRQQFKVAVFSRLLRSPKRTGAVTFTPEIYASLRQELVDNDYDVWDFQIDVQDYRQYFARANYDQFGQYQQNMGSGFREKTLQHYVAAKLLELTPQDRYIDIASCDSPVPKVYGDLFGCEIWRQDILWPEGIRGREIGGDAAAMPVENGFATAMALHCSFEHFEGDADRRFIREASRVLCHGGRLCILPLYLNPYYAIQTDPAVLPRKGMKFEPDATLHLAHGWRNRHGRYYDISHLNERVRKQLGDLKLTIYHVTNAHEVDGYCGLRFAALFTKP